MASLHDIKAPVAWELEEFNRYYRGVLEVPSYGLRVILWYVLRAPGKQLRPLLCYLSAAATGGVSGTTKVAAAMIELVHNASLIHDDVVDQSAMRRGRPSVMRLWHSKGAVLAGDYMLAQGLRLAVEQGQSHLLSIMNVAVQQMSVGELEQLRLARRYSRDPKGYYQVIQGKTAALLSASCAAGAYTAGASKEASACLEEYGRLLGLAFQIRDDILDFLPQRVLNKSAGNDLKEGKMTMPMLLALDLLPSKESQRLHKLIRRAPKDSHAQREAIELVRHSGAIEAAHGKVREFAAQAKRQLEALPTTPARESLLLLADYIVETLS